VLAIVIGLLVTAAAVVVALIATSTIGGKSSSNASSRAGLAHAGQARPVAFNPRAVTVAVLNGTGTPGLAGRTSHMLSADGYKPGTVATASDQTQSSTVVAYLPGYRADAEHVAAALKLPATAVQQVNPTEQAVACPPPAQCSANVVVTVGADLASS
jgi:hypothetical protein